jgi:hypothetical protein
MLRKLFFACLVCPILVWGATTASAVTFDLSSPQNGTVVHPGGTLQLTVAIGNDTANPEVIVVALRHTLTVNGHTFVLGTANRVRLRLEPGQTVTKTLELTIPAQLPAQFTSATLTIDGTARGLESGTSASSSVSFTIENP